MDEWVDSGSSVPGSAYTFLLRPQPSLTLLQQGVARIAVLDGADASRDYATDVRFWVDGTVGLGAHSQMSFGEAEGWAIAYPQDSLRVTPAPGADLVMAGSGRVRVSPDLLARLLRPSHLLKKIARSNALRALPQFQAFQAFPMNTSS